MCVLGGVEGKGECGFGGLVIDKDMWYMVDGTRSLEEGDGDDVTYVDANLGEGDFVFNVEGVKDMFEFVVVLRFVMVQVDDM